MTTRGLFSVGLKLVGVLYLAYAVTYIPLLIGFFARQTEDKLVSVPLAVAANLSGVILFGFIAWALIAKSEKLADRLMPTDSEDLGLGFSAEVFQAIAFSVLGIYLVVNALPQLVAIGWSFAASGSSQFGWSREDFLLRNWQALGVGVVKLLLGVGLFAGSRWLANLWNRWRSIPRPDALDGDAT
jgi:hypothetical protein